MMIRKMMIVESKSWADRANPEILGPLDGRGGEIA
jgi:hypothetical protein